MYTSTRPTRTSAPARQHAAVMRVLDHLGLPPGRLQELEHHWQSYTPEAFSLLHQLLLELRHGVQPKYLVTWHWSPQQRDYTSVSLATRHFRNVLLKRVWGYNCIQQTRVAAAPPLVFSHERSTEANRFHTHLLIPQPRAPHDSLPALSHELNGHFRISVRAVERDRTIDVKPVSEPVGVMSYIVKQASSNYCPLDFELSGFLHQTYGNARKRRDGGLMVQTLAMK